MSGSGTELTGRVLHPGTGRGPLLPLAAPLSFWGGTNAAGEVIDVHHPQRGRSLVGRVVVMASGRGSSSSSAVLAEQIRSGAAPAAILLTEPDTIVVIGALAAAELYAIALPVVQIRPRDRDDLAIAGRSGRVARVAAGPDAAVVSLEEP